MTTPPRAEASNLQPLGHVRHGYFTRQGGVSGGIYDSLNCGFGSDDARDAVAENRARVAGALGAAGDRLVTVHQIHSCDVVEVTEPWTPDRAPRADAMVTRTPGIVLGVLAADCAPVLLADTEAGVIGAAHAGWKGALGGIVGATLDAMERAGAARSRVVATIGPCIGPVSYEVGLEFMARFTEADPDHARHFAPGRSPEKRQFDLPGFLLDQIGRLGMADVRALGLDTLTDPARWFSYRRTTLQREPDYGRQISAITLA